MLESEREDLEVQAGLRWGAQPDPEDAGCQRECCKLEQKSGRVTLQVEPTSVQGNGAQHRQVGERGEEE